MAPIDTTGSAAVSAAVTGSSSSAIYGVEKPSSHPLEISIKSPGGEQGLATLSLHPLCLDDLASFHELHADPRVWEHLPSGQHTTLDRSRQDLAALAAEWVAVGLSYWAVRDAQGGLAAVGGARLIGQGTVWNLYYRVAPRYWGCGIAAKVAHRAVEAARRLQPHLPIVAYLLEHNTASKRIAEQVLASPVRWRGPDAGNDDPHAVRLVYSDRPLDDAALRVVTS